MGHDEKQSGLFRWLISMSDYIFLFLGLYGFIYSIAEEGDREGDRHAAKRPRPGVEPRSAAEPQHTGRPLYQLS